MYKYKTKMSAPEVATAPLNYSDVKRKAIASKSLRTLVFPSNGQTFNCGQQINFQTQANSPGLYLDSAMSYMKLKITNNNNASTITLDQSAYSLINRLLITSAGQVFQDTQHYNLLHNVLTSMSAGKEYVGNNGRILAGMGDVVSSGETFKGQTIAAGGSLTVSLPLALSPLVQSTPYRYIYLGGRAPFEFKLTLADGTEAFQSADALLQNADITISDFEFVGYHVQLNDEAQRQVSAMSGGKYNILATEYVNFQTTLSANVNTLSFPLGLARSSVDRVIVVHRPQSTINSATAFSLSNRCKADMENIRLMVSGQSIPQRRIEVGSQGGNSVALAEYLISNHNLDDMSHVSNLFYVAGVDNFELNGSNGTNASTVGSFVVAINTDSFTTNSDKVFSGINTISQSVFLEVNYDTVPVNSVVDVYAQNTILLSMDENAGAVYQVSV